MSTNENIISTLAIPPPMANRVSRRPERPPRNPLRSEVSRNTIDSRSNLVGNFISYPLDSQRSGSDCITDSFPASNSLSHLPRIRLPNLSTEDDLPMASHRVHTPSYPLHTVALVLSHRVHDFFLGQVLLMLVYIGVIIYASFYKSNPLTDTYQIGWVLASQLPFLCSVLATDNNIIDRIIDVVYEKLNFLRRLLRRVLMHLNVHSLDNVCQRSFGIISEKITEHFVRCVIIFVKHVVLIVFLLTACYYAPGCIPYMIVVGGFCNLSRELMIACMELRNLSDVHRFIMVHARQMLEILVMMCKETGRWTGSLLDTPKTSLYGEIGGDAGHNATLKREAPYGDAGNPVMSSSSDVTLVVGEGNIPFPLSVEQVLMQSGASHVKIVVECIQDPVNFSATTRVRVHIFNDSMINPAFNERYLWLGNNILPGFCQTLDTRLYSPSTANTSQRPEEIAHRDRGRVGAVDVPMANRMRPLPPLPAPETTQTEVPMPSPSITNSEPQVPKGMALVRRHSGRVAPFNPPTTTSKFHPHTNPGMTRDEVPSPVSPIANTRQMPGGTAVARRNPGHVGPANTPIATVRPCTLPNIRTSWD